MAKTTIGNNGAAYIEQAQASLKQAGIDTNILDRMIAAKTIDAILADSPAVQQYFQAANRGMWAILEPKDLREVRGALPPPEHYREYFDNQVPQPTPYFNYIPAEDLFNPQRLEQKAGFTKEQTYAYTMLLQGPPQEAPATWPTSGQGAPSGGAPSAPSAPSQGPGTNPDGGYGGGGSSYGGGSAGAGKGMSIGGGSNTNPQSKAAGMPGPPPGGGAPGGFPPPPPPGGFGGGGGGGYDPTGGLDPHQALQPYYDYVGSNLGGHWSEGWLNQLGGTREYSAGILASGAQKLDEVRKIRAQLVDALANADPKEVMALNAKMQDATTMEREITDMMMRAEKYFNEQVNFTKGLLDLGFKTQESIIRNIRN